MIRNLLFKVTLKVDLLSSPCPTKSFYKFVELLLTVLKCSNTMYVWYKYCGSKLKVLSGHRVPHIQTNNKVTNMNIASMIVYHRTDWLMQAQFDYLWSYSLKLNILMLQNVIEWIGNFLLSFWNYLEVVSTTNPGNVFIEANTKDIMIM